MRHAVVASRLPCTFASSFGISFAGKLVISKVVTTDQLVMTPNVSFNANFRRMVSGFDVDFPVKNRFFERFRLEAQVG